MMYTVVLFDLDDTLVDHRTAATTALDHWMGELGRPRDDAATDLWFALEDQHYAKARTGEISWPEHRRRRARDFFAALDLDGQDLDDAFARYLVAYQRAWVAFPDAAPILTALRAQGIQTALVTNGMTEQQVAKTVATGLSELCGPVFASELIGVAKPDPEIFRRVCARLDVAPDEVAMVGDNYELDVLAPRSIGIRGIHLDRFSKHPIDGSDRITSLAQLPQTLVGDPHHGGAG